MKFKKENILLVAAVLALSLYLLVNKTDRSFYDLPKFKAIPEKEVSKIRISKKNSIILLKKKDDTWSISPKEYRADSGMVKEMLNIIDNLTMTALVSESKDYIRYNLNDDNKIVVKVWSGDTLKREFEVGKTVSTYKHTFVRLAGDDRIYHARGNFRGIFDKTVEELRDKKVLAFEKADIREIHIKKGEKSIVFIRKKGLEDTAAGKNKEDKNPEQTETKITWQTAGGKRGDKSHLDSLLAGLSGLHCDKFINNRNKEDFTEPVYTVLLKGVKEHTLSIFAKKDENSKDYPAISSGTAYPFILSEWQALRIMKDPSELIEKHRN
ncbi:MAG: DUF4340 domain-containing protein [Deltaproteobacteria bacterium]|nr:DUF4340 domain-containing protein [Deltaproteobacteria bacterium]